MKRLTALFSAFLLLCLSACSHTQPDPEPPEYSAAPAISASVDAPAMSAGAADSSRLSALFQDDGGTLYTTVFRDEDVTCLYDTLPDDLGSVAGFFITDDGAYISVKEYYYSLEPATLYHFPADGSAGRVVAGDLLPSGLFCMAGDAIFYENYGDEHLWRLDTATGQSRCVLERPVQLLSAGDGFIYYAADGDIYRNDSTMSAETLLFSDAGVRYLFADEGRLCALTFDDTGKCVISLRGPDGAPRAEITPDESTDNILCRDGHIYIPQLAAKKLLVYDFDGSSMQTFTLEEAAGYILLRGAADGAVYYETMAGDEAAVYRADLHSGQIRRAGELIYR